MIPSFGLSPCPNDTYIFYHFIHNLNIEPVFLDVEELNQLAMQEKLPLVKVSCFTAVRLKHYEILSSGGAIGFGCGPLIVSNTSSYSEKDFFFKIQKHPIYIPGSHTTANFLFHQFCKSHKIQPTRIQYIRYDKIIPELQKTSQPALGVLIHEERFTYLQKNLYKEIDLGAWWESATQLPIPLGCIVIHKDYVSHKKEIEKAIQKSILYAKKNFDIVYPFIQKHAQTMDKKAIISHIRLYVTNFSFDMKEQGKKALEYLKQFASTI